MTVSFYLNESVGPNLLAIFGSNIAIVAGIILLLGQRAFGRRYAPPLAIVGIIIHTLPVGESSCIYGWIVGSFDLGRQPFDTNNSAKA